MFFPSKRYCYETACNSIESDIAIQKLQWPISRLNCPEVYTWSLHKHHFLLQKVIAQCYPISTLHSGLEFRLSFFLDFHHSTSLFHTDSLIKTRVSLWQEIGNKFAKPHFYFPFSILRCPVVLKLGYKNNISLWIIMPSR